MIPIIKVLLAVILLLILFLVMVHFLPFSVFLVIFFPKILYKIIAHIIVIVHNEIIKIL